MSDQIVFEVVGLTRAPVTVDVENDAGYKRYELREGSTLTVGTGDVVRVPVPPALLR